MRKIDILLFTIATLSIFSSCTKKGDAPSVADNILNYTINEIPVTTDYTVGAFYYNFTAFNTNTVEVPTVGKYSMVNGVVPSVVMTNHIQQAKRGGIDYFLFPLRSVSRDLVNFRIDSSTVKSFLDVNTDNLKFALAYNFLNTTFAISTTAPLENDAVKLAKITCEYKMIAKDSANMGQNLEKVKEFEKIASDIQDKYTDKLKSMTGKDKEAMQKVLKRSYEDELAKCKE